MERLIVAEYRPSPPSSQDPESAPRWVKVFGIIALLVIVIVLIIHLAGGGFTGTQCNDDDTGNTEVRTDGACQLLARLVRFSRGVSRTRNLRSDEQRHGDG